jgi:membrane fusion protein, multidrug efflux system
MKRLLPYLIFVLITGGLVAFVYKDRIFPPDPNAAEAQQGMTGGPGSRPRGNSFRRGNRPVPVSIEKARTENVPVYLSGVGTVQAFNTAFVRAQVSGRLIEVNYKEGQEVKAGDVLAKIDPVLYQAIYDQVVAKKAQDEALLANARRDEQRYSSLASANYSSQQQADTAKSQVKQYEAQIRQDQAQIDNARANLEYATVRAPIDGRTGIRLVDAGNLVSASDATGIVVVTQLRPITVVFTLPENTVSEVLAAQAKGAVPLQAITGGATIGEGTLLVVDNQIDQSTGTVRIKGVFANQENRLWPGQFVNVKLKLKTLENAIVTSSVAIQQGASGSYVYLATPENTAKLTYVKVVQEGEKMSVIGDGIAPGDDVITSGFANLQDGSKLKLETPTPEGAPQANAAPATDEAAKDGKGEGKGERKRRRKEAAVEGAASAAEQGEDAKKQGEDGKKRGKRGEKPEASKDEGPRKP